MFTQNHFVRNKAYSILKQIDFMPKIIFLYSKTNFFS